MAGYKYALNGPPFNFLGNFSETQLGNLKTWVNDRISNFPKIQLHYQIRAQQLRKTAGALEQFYQSVNDQKLTPSFKKEAWSPGPNGHFAYAYREDHLPMVAVKNLKIAMKPQFQRDDEAVFAMNHTRAQIEKLEDLAQAANDAVNSSLDKNVSQILADITGMFAQNRYQAVLVKDKSDQYGVGAAAGPRFRVHQFDEPSQWELERMNHSSPKTPIMIKEEV